MLVVVCAIVATLVLSSMVPLASGGSVSQTVVNVFGISEDQADIRNDAQEERLAKLEGAVNTDVLSQVSLASEREDLEYVDQDELQKAILDQQAALETAEQKKKEAAAAQKKADAAAAVKAAKEAQQAELEAQKAQKKAEDTAAQAAVQGNDWMNVVASCYYDVGLPIANGSTLAANDLVIAHKTLPLGTRVEIEYRGKRVRASVQDRGPYIAGRDIDLSPGVQQALGLYDGVTPLKMRLLA